MNKFLLIPIILSFLVIVILSTIGFYKDGSHLSSKNSSGDNKSKISPDSSSTNSPYMLGPAISKYYGYPSNYGSSFGRY